MDSARFFPDCKSLFLKEDHMNTLKGLMFAGKKIADLIFVELIFAISLKITEINSTETRKIEVVAKINSGKLHIFMNILCINL